MRKSLRTFIILVLSVGLLALFLRGANLSVVWTEMRNANSWLIALSAAVTVVTMVLRALRWQYLLAPIGYARFIPAFRTTMIGFAASAVLPARAGEVIRPYLLARQESLSATATFATIIIERLLDAVTCVILLASFVLLFDPGNGQGQPHSLFAARSRRRDGWRSRAGRARRDVFCGARSAGGRALGLQSWSTSCRVA